MIIYKRNGPAGTRSGRIKRRLYDGNGEKSLTQMEGRVDGGQVEVDLG